MPLTLDMSAAEVTAKVNTGTITAGRFVKAVIVGGDVEVMQAGLGDHIFGVALDDGDVDVADKSRIAVARSPHRTAQVTAGGTVTAGDLVMSDVDGKAVEWDDNHHSPAGRALIGGQSGDTITIDGSEIGTPSAGAPTGGSAWAVFTVNGFGITAASGDGYRGLPLSSTPNNSGAGAPTLNETNDGIVVDPTRAHIVIARVDFDTDTDGLMQVDVVGYPGGTGQQYVVAGEHIVSATGFHLGAVVGGPPISLNIYADGAISNVYDGYIAVCSVP